MQRRSGRLADFTLVDRVRRTTSSLPRWTKWVMLAVVLTVEIGAIVTAQLSGSDIPPRSIVREQALARLGVEVYEPPRGTVRARAIIIFFVDPSCWRPYRQLASSLSSDGYAVVAIPPRLLPMPVEEADSSHSHGVFERAAAIITRGVHAIDGNVTQRIGEPETAVVLMGHAHGAASALWMANHIAIAGLRGVIALAPPVERSTGADLTPGIAWTAGAGESGLRAAASQPHKDSPYGTVTIASIHGSLGPRALLSRGRLTDSTHVAFTVPFSTARLASPILTGLAVRSALDWILVRR